MSDLEYSLHLIDEREFQQRYLPAVQGDKEILRELLAREMEALLRLSETGRIKPRIDSTFSFDQAADAHQRMHDRKNIGKIVLTP